MKKLWAALCRREKDRVDLQVTTPKNGALQASGPAAAVLELARWWEASRPDADDKADKPKLGFQKAD